MRLQFQLDEKVWMIKVKVSFTNSTKHMEQKANDISLGNDNDKNVGGDDIDMQPQPNYPDFCNVQRNHIFVIYFFTLSLGQ